MSNSGKSQSGIENRFLAALSGAEYERLTPHLQPVSVETNQVIYRPNQPIEYASFPIAGTLSMLTTMQDGSSVGVGTVGKDGMIGFHPLLGMKSMPQMALGQIPGRAMRIKSEALKGEFDRGGKLQLLLHRYIQAQFVQMAQGAACNRLHEVSERLARWLLITRDCVASDDFPLTQEFLAQMLGVNRSTVSLTAGTLQQAGLIRYRRGHITILDHEQLEEIACECYGVIRAEIDRSFDL